MRHNNDISITEILNSLSESFTEDAMFLIHSYFDILQTKLETFRVPQTKQGFILKGLYYFINEYIEDHMNKNSIISFETTLNILNEIGSPLDIIQTLSSTKDSQMTSITKSEPSTASRSQSFSELTQKANHLTVCQYCHTSSESSSNYCENCGKNLFDQQDFLQNIKQEIIDHNYFITFLFCWFGFVILQAFFYVSFGISMFSILFPDIHLKLWSIPFSESLAISMILSSIPAFIVSLIVGFLFDQLYFNKLKSSKQKYNQAIEKLQERFILGIWLNVIGIILFLFLILNGFTEFIFLLMIVLWMYGVSIWNHFFLKGKPNDVPYFKLLSTKKLLDKHVKEKYFVFNPISMFMSIILAALWAFLAEYLLYPELEFQELVLVGGLGMIALFIIVNGIFFMYFYNWSYIKKIIQREMRRMNDPPLNLT
ncbi:MAG: hypothetical protein ACW990_20215 [Promethearchaeota archaeon]|jgi:hypothetical protein